MTIIIPLVNTSQIGLVAVSIGFGALATMIIGLRLVAARISHRYLDASDYTILVAWVLTMGLMVTCILEAVLGGFGWHYTEIMEQFGPVPIEQYHKIIIPLEMLWALSLTATKLSVLLFYTKVFAVTNINLPAKITIVIVALLGLSGVLCTLLICQPIEFNWNLTLPGGHCGSQSAVFAIFGITNLVTDVVVLLMPIPSLTGLRMPIWKKASLLATFVIGFITCIASIVRLVYLSKIDYNDVTYTSVLAVLMSAVEPALALILACIPLLRPLIGPQSRHFSTTASASKSGGFSMRMTGGWSSRNKTFNSSRKSRQSIRRLGSSDAEFGTGGLSIVGTRTVNTSRYESDMDGVELQYVLSPGENVSHHARVEAMLPRRHSSLTSSDDIILQQIVDVKGANAGMGGGGSGIVVKQEWNVESEPI